MSTLAQLRAKLNGELGVDDDTETAPWSQSVRNDAIADGYAELWRVGVWKPLTQTATTVDDQWTYTLTSIRRLERLELLDSSSRVVDLPHGIIEDDGAGGFRLRLASPLAAGYSLVVRGWGAYISTFANDASTDDLPAEYARIPILKAKEICCRRQLARFARYGSRESVPPEMNVTVGELLAIAGAAGQEFAEAVSRVTGLRRKTSKPITISS